MILATTREIAAMLRVPRGTVYRWAVEDGWTKYGTRARRYYDLADASTTYSQRRDKP